MTSGERIASCEDDKEVGLSMSQKAIRHYILMFSTTGFEVVRRAVVSKIALMLKHAEKRQLRTQENVVGILSYLSTYQRS